MIARDFGSSGTRKKQYHNDIIWILSVWPTTAADGEKSRVKKRNYNFLTIRVSHATQKLNILIQLANRFDPSSVPIDKKNSKNSCR